MKKNALKLLTKCLALSSALLTFLKSPKVKRDTIKFLKEYTAVLIALLVFFLSPYVLQMIDSTAATYDAGVLQVIIMAIVQFTILQAATWNIVKAIWPAIGLYMKDFFNTEFLNLPPWEKLRISLFVYFAILSVLVLLSRVIK